jgi:cardiolipin synthase
VSEFGKVFDPTVDRLLFVVAITAIIIDGRRRSGSRSRCRPRGRRQRHDRLRHTRVQDAVRRDLVGKAATFLLMLRPGFMLGTSDFPGQAGSCSHRGWSASRARAQLLHRDHLYSTHS